MRWLSDTSSSRAASSRSRAAAFASMRWMLPAARRRRQDTRRSIYVQPVCYRCSLHAVASPELDLVLAVLRNRPRGDDLSVPQLRARLEELAATIPVPDGTRCAKVLAGTVPGEWVAGPRAADHSTLFYL